MDAIVQRLELGHVRCAESALGGFLAAQALASAQTAIATCGLGVEVERALHALVSLDPLRLLERPMRRRHLPLCAVWRK